jgi:hypothetical protein
VGDSCADAAEAIATSTSKLTKEAEAMANLSAKLCFYLTF